jgi:hypothetical protein
MFFVQLGESPLHGTQTNSAMPFGSAAVTRTEYLLASPLPTILEIGIPNLLGAKK